jgi:uncharacterized protein
MSDQAKGDETTGDAATKAVFDRIEQLLEFPAKFPLKIMGLRQDDFAQNISNVIIRHIPDYNPAGMELRVSSKGTYLSLTADLVVQSRDQLEALYKEVAAHPQVKVVL